MRRQVGSNQYRTRWAPWMGAPDVDLMVHIQTASDIPHWDQHPQEWNQVLQWVCGPLRQHQIVAGHLVPVPHPLAPQDVVQVLNQSPGDPDEHPGQGEPWKALVRCRDGRCMLLQGYPSVDNKYAASLVGDSPQDLADQLSDASQAAGWFGESADILLDHPEVSADTISRWARSDNPDLQWAAACSPRLDPASWVQLLQGYAGVKCRALCHPVADPEMLQRLAEEWMDQGTRTHQLHSIARNPSCPVPLWHRLMQHEDLYVRQGALLNPNCPEEYRTLAKIAKI